MRNLFGLLFCFVISIVLVKAIIDFIVTMVEIITEKHEKEDDTK
jgi:hypothetical protein